MNNVIYVATNIFLPRILSSPSLLSNTKKNFFGWKCFEQYFIYIFATWVKTKIFGSGFGFVKIEESFFILHFYIWLCGSLYFYVYSVHKEFKSSFPSRKLKSKTDVWTVEYMLAFMHSWFCGISLLDFFHEDFYVYSIENW